MAETQHQPRFVRFGAFEVDLRIGEMRKAGVKLKFSGQPFVVLCILLERPGDVVAREELQRRLWPDTFVDVERNLNTAINKIREVLGDSAESPRFVETVPRRGYRFIAPVEADRPAADPPITTPLAAERQPSPLADRLALLCLVILALGGVAYFKTVFRTPRPPTIVRYRKLTEDGQQKFSLASDGVRVYFNELLPDGRKIIAQVSVNGGEVVPLSLSLKQPRLLDLSKDGTALLVVSQAKDGNSLWVQPVAGGSPQRVASGSGGDAACGVDGAAFSPEDGRIISRQGHDVYSANRDGTSRRKLLTVENAPFYFRFSPDGTAMRFSQLDLATKKVTTMDSLTDGTDLQTMFDGCCGNWTQDGRFFIFLRSTGGNFGLGQSELWASAQRKFRWQKPAEPVPLLVGPLDFTYPLPGKDGKEIFALGKSQRAEVVRYDSRSGDFVPYLSGISAEGLAFSRDGHWVSYVSYPEGTLWRSRVDGSERLQLTFPPMKVFMPRWSPDGKSIALNAMLPGGFWNVYVIPAEGGSAERLLPPDQGRVDADWSPDGESLIFGSAEEPSRSIDILDIRSRRIFTLPGSKGFFSPHWSPDGRYISATIIATGHLMLFDIMAQSWSLACDCDVDYPMWSQDGKFIYFEEHQDLSYRIARLSMTTRRIEKVAELSNIGRLTTGTVAQWFGLTPDQSPLLARDISTQEVYALDIAWP